MKTVFETTNAPAPVGPYNQAIAYNGVLYVSGQVALNPATGKLVQGSIEEETHQVLKNILAILSEAGTNLESVLKASVFVSDMGNYSRINAVYSEYFNEDTAPARELVQVADLPLHVNVEISVIAALPQAN